MRLTGKTVIITGASSGIGAAAARLFHSEGANLVVGARRGLLLRELVDQLPGGKQRAVWLAGDVREEEYAESLVRLAQTEFGGLDAAFNNAGTLGDLGPVETMPSENWRDVIATNLNSAFFASKHQIPAMIERGSGSIVFTSSFVGHTIGLPGMAAYAASKAGLVGLTQVLAAEYGARSIRVNALLPGGTMTAMAGDNATFHDFVRGLHALKRIAEPEEIARAALFLVSGESSFVTGSAMLVDGGNSITKT